MERNETRVEVPADCRLVGARTDGDVAVIIYEPIQSVRQIGFIHYPEPTTKTRTNPIIKKMIMQYNNKDYEPTLHDRWRALTVKNPYATQLVTAAYEDNGIVYGEKCIEVRSRNTSHRGDVLICSAASPVYPGMESGVTLGLVELYDVKPIKEFTPEDWENTRIPKEKRAKITKGYGWLMRNPRRVIEFPIKGQLGIYNLVYTKGCIVEYPKVMVLDKEAYNKIKETY